jgi:phosphoglucomutase
MLSSHGSAAGNDLNITTISVKPFAGQRPDISGLWKKAKEFMQPGYVEAFVQATFNATRGSVSGDFSKSTLVLGGEGDSSKEVIQKILRVAIGNEFGRVLVAREGILSESGVSAVIRRRKALGGLFLSANGRTSDVDADFGIKYIISNGEPAPQDITERIYEFTQLINHYYWFESDDIELHNLGTQTYAVTAIEVFDPLAQ